MNKSKDIKFIIGMLVLIVGICGFALWDSFQKEDDGISTAIIMVGGKDVLNIELDGKKDSFQITGEAYVTDEDPDAENIVATFEKDENGIRFVNSQCPDHICENTGYCLYKGDTAICMPAQITLVIE
ncbi:MAG: NusG domain II-containing protein [Oscillospiraceae bacterium]|nr:NusG domain II-containing protein [Oscillospiraceae bacterium]